MSTTEIEGGRLFELYARYVGEPGSRKDVYGYWFFLAGALISFFGVILFLFGPTQAPKLLFRGLALGLSALGLPLGMLGIILLLPVKRIGIVFTVLGSVASLAATVGFVWAYPDHWPPYAGPAVDYSPQLIGAYTGGIALMVAVAVLVPILTGEKSFFFQQEYERSREYPEVVVGEALRGGLFTVYRTGKEWTWRLIDQEAIAGSVNSYLSRLETEESVQRIKAKVEEAGLLEIKHAAFRLYEAAEDRWQWVLMAEDGSVVANSDEEFDTRNDAADAVNNLKELGPDADVITIEGGGAFKIIEGATDVRWQLVDDERNLLAEGPTGYDTRGEAEDGIARAREEAPGARTLVVESIGVEIFEESEAASPWHWRLLDSADNELARSENGYDEHRAAEEAIYDLLEHVASAPVLDSEEPAYEVVPSDGGWEFRLVDDDEQTVAHSHDEFSTPGPAEDLARTMADGATKAEVVSIDDADFEYYRASDGWHWRLVTEDRDVLAESIDAYNDKDAAEEAIDQVKTMADDADLIEFEKAAFQLYEHQGEWRWRLIDEDGNVMADSGEEHDSKDSAAASMMTIKEQAPDADVLEIEAAAFELFHDDDEDWNWRLVDISGETVARGPEMLPSRDAARDAMERLQTSSATSEAREMEGAVFQVYADRNDWYWRYVTPDGTIVADSADRYGTRDEAVTEIEDELRDVAAAGDVATIEHVALQVDARGERYSWRVLDPDRSTVATSSRSYVERAEADAEVQQFRDDAHDASVFELSDATFQLRGADDVWQWRLVTDGRETVMNGPGHFDTREAAEEAIEYIQDIIPNADLLDYEGAAFEMLQVEDRWQWRLVDENGRILASSAQHYANRSDCEAGIEEIRAELEDASILEIEIAAFELFEDDGIWGWRLIDENGVPMAESLGNYESRREARETMEALKDFAPEALTSVAE